MNEDRHGFDTGHDYPASSSLPWDAETTCSVVYHGFTPNVAAPLGVFRAAALQTFPRRPA